MNTQSFYKAVDIVGKSASNPDYWIEMPNNFEAKVFMTYELIESVRKKIEMIDK